jgi:hypothetical protein
MTKNLETADNIAKLVLASLTIVLFLSGIIAGAFAVLLVILSVLIWLIYVTRELFARTNRRKRRRLDME